MEYTINTCNVLGQSSWSGIFQQDANPRPSLIVHYKYLAFNRDMLNVGSNV